MSPHWGLLGPIGGLLGPLGPIEVYWVCWGFGGSPVEGASTVDDRDPASPYLPHT